MSALLQHAETTVAAGTIWRLVDGLRWRAWEGEAVAYNDRTGDTHHFADFAAWIFARLCAGPASADDLEQDAAEAVELTSGASLADTVERTLALLRRLQMIEPAA
jgi:PqqD family protein of HPr-rel-A system